jgi:endonuclease/exonuclease/phosphatase (EEP) superfamily protein YafD
VIARPVVGGCDVRFVRVTTVDDADRSGTGQPLPVIVGGDFNAQPGEMAALLDAGRGGRFVDTDPQRAPTRGQKIDYVLFSRGHFSNPSGGPQTSKYSDHKVLLGQASRQ